MMKKGLLLVCLATMMLSLSACQHRNDTTVPQTTTRPPVGTTAEPNTTTLPATTVPPAATQPPVLTGWQIVDGNTYFYHDDGTMATGWQDMEGKRYYFRVDGILCTGWLPREEGLYYLGEDGVMVTGWLELEGKRYCFTESGNALIGWQEENGVRRYFKPDGALAVGWLQLGEDRYYMDAEGTMQIGWIDVEDRRYYLQEDGRMLTGWLQQAEKLYYLRPDGSMARGCVEIDGVKTYFTSTGDYILLVNPWNYLPEGYDPQLVSLNRYNGYDNMWISQICYEPLVQMLADCRQQCQIAYVVSSYRTQEFQEKNFERKVQQYLNMGYSREEAERLAATVVAVPGTSEHQSGLAVDIVDAKLWSLEDVQADMPAQKWLMEHSWEYGFILRYPKGKTDVTGIIYEPWHYRYVGKELAAELHELNLTLEEYLDQLTAEEAAK